ncbi:transposase IS116/IS110/IS902 family protein [Desulfotomaculum nigrificans CO-1-SRB]|uniref:Transposase IS116/IS110/IS902 family protein n=1 Tax=Desulfotomaculum nigrificans (strain DSM 14880 / VKM B-2319 / CO-1-SRB) TaxID=868595 RepID=F6B8Y4_DESCC|nr:IS110 family transposase [Desulfotomaculum nigrificans]AEF93635.1 transposase IS116/IS110/IS902 family protein [Desulfotomaculum nigrificans CO-1-SRB]
MKYSQNSKIMQITENTLVIGVDVANEVHYARVFDYRGIEFGRPVKFSNNYSGFSVFAEWVRQLKKEHQKEHVMVGMEPTGHYWFAFAKHLKDHRIKIVLVNPFHVKRSKELDDNNPTKNDRKDPKTIAMLVKDGRYMEPYIPEGIYSELRNAMDTRWRLVKGLNSIRNRVKRWISIYFPEFNQVFGDWEGKAALMVLKEFPTPARVLELGIGGIVTTWRKEISRAVGVKRAKRLVEAAKATVGMRQGLRAAENELKCLLEEYGVLMRQYERTMVLIEELTFQVPGVEEMLKIKGVGLITAAGFIAEVGDITRFEHPRQVQKLGGLSLKENSSGKHKGKATISKRGRKRLRAILFQGIMPLVARNEEFRELHRYYTTMPQNPLKKKQSLILLCCKLIRIFFALITKKTAYDPQKMMKDIKRSALQAA